MRLPARWMQISGANGEYSCLSLILYVHLMRMPQMWAIKVPRDVYFSWIFVVNKESAALPLFVKVQDKIIFSLFQNVKLKYF